MPVEGKVRIQLNLKVEQAKHINSVKNFRDIVFPIVWVEEVSSVSGTKQKITFNHVHYIHLEVVYRKNHTRIRCGTNEFFRSKILVYAMQFRIQFMIIRRCSKIFFFSIPFVCYGLFGMVSSKIFFSLFKFRIL